MEDYFKDKIIWTLKDNSNILYINQIEDLDKFLEKGYITKGGYNNEEYVFDFVKISKEYDAIQLNNGCIGHYFKSVLELLLNAWDCESIVVINPENIIILEEGSI